MNRKEITTLLTETLIRDRMANGAYYAKEVTLDFGTTHSKRVDVMEFRPNGAIYASDIEKGTFVCYEIKSCVEDVYSGHGLRFYGEKNFIVTTMETYRKLGNDIREGKLDRYIRENYPESSLHYGFIVLVPETLDLKSTDEKYEEFEHPTPLSSGVRWKTCVILPCRHEGRRTRGITELLFCMLRAKQSYTNCRDLQ